MLGQQLLLVRFQPLSLNPHRCTRRAIAMVLGQVQHTFPKRHLQVQRKVVFKPVLPIDLEPQEIDVELQRFGLVKTAQNGSDFS